MRVSPEIRTCVRAKNTATPKADPVRLWHSRQWHTETFAGSPLLPWVSKIDWMLETILKSLAKSHPGSVSIARLSDVDISAGGLGFDTPREFQAEDLLVLKVILPPFSMIETVQDHSGDAARTGQGRISPRHPVCRSGR